jgi:hypothetical protein
VHPSDANTDAARGGNDREPEWRREVRRRKAEAEAELQEIHREQRRTAERLLEELGLSSIRSPG